jgi:hypothetical protein
MGQKRTHALQQKESSSDQPVGTGEQRRRSSLPMHVPKHDWLHGRDIRLPDLRQEIAQCERRRQMHDTCMVRYFDLSRAE